MGYSVCSTYSEPVTNSKERMWWRESRSTAGPFSDLRIVGGSTGKAGNPTPLKLLYNRHQWLSFLRTFCLPSTVQELIHFVNIPMKKVFLSIRILDYKQGLSTPMGLKQVKAFSNNLDIMMVHFMCQLARLGHRCPATWSNILLCLWEWILDEINTYLSRLGNADCPPWREWLLSNHLKVQNKMAYPPISMRWPDCLELRHWSSVFGLKLKQQLFLCLVSTGFLD